MTKLLRSFVAGVGSILSIYPQHRANACSRDVIGAIGGDFARVGGDIARVIEIKAALISAPKETLSHGEGKAEQLDLIPG